MQEEKLRKLRAKLCENLRKARLDAGYSQKEAAALLEKPQSFISKCELGERKILPEELFIIAKIYKKDISFFFSGMEEIWKEDVPSRTK
jgi:transcriptional regulator with XRE-family HTH domain